MKTDRRKNASLALNAILRGLEFDQIVFHYDPSARPDVGCTAVREVSIGSSSGLLALTPRERTTTAA
jgi:hypothetical protein